MKTTLLKNGAIAALAVLAVLISACKQAAKLPPPVTPEDEAVPKTGEAGTEEAKNEAVPKTGEAGTEEAKNEAVPKTGEAGTEEAVPESAATLKWEPRISDLVTR